MIDPSLLGDLAKQHQKNLLSRTEAKDFLRELMALCSKHGVLIRTPDQILQFSKTFGGSSMRTVLKAIINKDGNCPAAKIEFK
jgi:hypothetical protein